MKNLLRQKGWYVALRYTDMLLQSKALKMMKWFIPQVHCRDQEYFLCGLCAQLQLAWEVARQAEDNTTQKRVVNLFSYALLQCKQGYLIAQEWAKLTARTLQLLCLTEDLRPLVYILRNISSSTLSTQSAAGTSILIDELYCWAHIVASASTFIPAALSRFLSL